MSQLTIRSLLLLLLLLPLIGAVAEPTPAERESWHGDLRGVIPRMPVAPTVDGLINDDEWHYAAEFNTQVSQYSPSPLNGRSFYPRQVIWYLGWDDENLYLASKTPLRENERPRWQARTSIGSAVMFDDTIEVWLDPKGRNEGKEMASYFQSMINGVGVTYFSRLYPSVAARSDNWRPRWTIATNSEHGYFGIEVKMPIADFAVLRNRPGDLWGILPARNFRAYDYNQSPVPFEFPGAGFSVNRYYPLMTLSDSLPFVKFRCPLPLYDGKAYAGALLLNPGKQLSRLRARLTISDEKGSTVVYSGEKVLEVPAGGQLDFTMNDPIAANFDPAKSASYRYAFTVTSEDGQHEIYHIHFPFDTSKFRNIFTTKLPPATPVGAMASFNPVHALLQTSVDVIDYPDKAKVSAARITVTDSKNNVLATSRTGTCFRDLYNELLTLPVLTPGTYTWRAALLLRDGAEVNAGEGTFEKKDEAKTFPWWNTGEGNAEKVLWPYIPISVELDHRRFHSWGKEFHLDGLALPEQILVTGNTDKWPAGRSDTPELLTEHIHLNGIIDGKLVGFASLSKPVIVSQAPHRITLTGSASAAGVRVTTATKLEQDGAYFVQMTVAPEVAGKAVTIESLDLSIPLRAEVATFLNAYDKASYSGYFIARLPETPLEKMGKGHSKVWDASLCGAPVVTLGDFIPQIWLGNEFRGLLWYADNDRGWTQDAQKHVQQIDRDGHSVILIHHLINNPITLNEPRTVAFVLQPTPMRPLQPGWRMLNTKFDQSFMLPDDYGRSKANYKANVNLAGDAAYAKSLAYAKHFPAFRAQQPDQELYFAPHTESSRIMTDDWGAIKYFGGEWEGGAYTKTLNDHTLCYIAKWVDKGGLQGLYHDQFCPHSIDSVSSGLAYQLPDGRVQPGFALTTRRDFVMREHALWMEHGIIPPRTLTHTTNGGPLGSYGWVESCLDGEDKPIRKDSSFDFAEAWPSDRIRAGSIAYNWGVTFSWMRLIDESGMALEEILRHKRVFAGHCLLHDVTNAYTWSIGGKTPLLPWGMRDDRVFFWPFWHNADVITCNQQAVRISAWTLPDRVLLCLFNYSKEQPADCTVTLNLAKMGVTLAAETPIHDYERPNQIFPGEMKAGKLTMRIPVNRRDFTLAAVGKAGQ